MYHPPLNTELFQQSGKPALPIFGQFKATFCSMVPPSKSGVPFTRNRVPREVRNRPVMQQTSGERDVSVKTTMLPDGIACTPPLSALPSNCCPVTERLHQQQEHRDGEVLYLSNKAPATEKGASLSVSEKTSLSPHPPPLFLVWSSSDGSEKRSLPLSDTCQMEKRKGQILGG